MKVKDYKEITKYGLILDEQNNLIDLIDDTKDKIIIPSCVKEIKNFSIEFKGDLIIEEGVKKISYNTFYMCLLKSVEIPGTIKEVDYFFDCCKLEKVTINEGTICIKEHAFSGCTKLREIILPDSIEQIKRCAFSYCPIEKLVLPKNLKILENSAFCCSNIEEITIPGTVKILDCPFSGCEKLKRITINEGVENITDYSFAGCINLEHVDIPNSLTYINISSFPNCNKLDRKSVV